LQQFHIRTIELVIAVSVVVISVASLFVAVYQGMVMERTLKASVWPLVQIEHGNYNPDNDSRELSFTLSNLGIGAAHVRTMEITYDGESLRNMYEVMSLCCADGETREDRQAQLMRLSEDRTLFITTTLVRDRLISPNDENTFFHFRRGENEDITAIWDALDQARWEMDIKVCYCSVFEDCWTIDMRSSVREEVRECAVPRD
jgi:hypothetical protein